METIGILFNSLDLGAQAPSRMYCLITEGYADNCLYVRFFKWVDYLSTFFVVDKII